MNEKQAPQNGTRPPMPRIMYRIVNPLMKLVLHSPLHGSISQELMILKFTGRKSGKQFSTPVGYARQGNTVLVFTHSSWWKNFIGGAPVTVYMQGKDIPGTARVVTDPKEVKAMLQSLIASNGEERARRVGIYVDHLESMDPQTAAQQIQGLFFVKIDLGAGSA